jgi:hypothetical protein
MIYGPRPTRRLRGRVRPAFLGCVAHDPTLPGVADVASMWGLVLTAADVMVAVPVALAAKDGRLPRWLCMLAAIFAAEQLVETITIVGAPGTFIAPGGS